AQTFLETLDLEAKDTLADTSKFALEAVSNVGEAVGPYLPLITAVAALTQQIVKAYESAQYNTKKSCAALIERVQSAEVAVQALNKRKQENERKFRNQSYYFNFERFVAILREIKGFIQDVTHLTGYRKFISSVHIKERFQQLITDFDSVVADLQLAMVIANEDERRNVFEHILTLKGKSSENGFNPIINRIDSKELKEPIGGSQPAASSRNKYKIYKKLYRGQDVACKLIDEEQNKSDKSDKSSETDGIVLSVFGWAENGNLRELYEKFDIEWPRKLKIALNICRGIIFLHGWLVRKHINNRESRTKISNFEYTYALQANTSDIRKFYKSFAVLVCYFGNWLPYRDMKISEIQKHVLSGKREHLSSYGVEEEYGNIIKADPSLRPELSYLFDVLEFQKTQIELKKFKAVELYKETADGGVPDAQLRHAFALPRKFNVNEFVRYLTMAADNGNTAAQFNLVIYISMEIGYIKR
ncbi:8486_t:CDS:2, partial [Rhizophagus irregularis]